MNWHLRRFSFIFALCVLAAASPARALEPIANPDCASIFSGSVKAGARIILKEDLKAETVNDLLKALDERASLLNSKFPAQDNVGHTLMFSQTHQELDALSFIQGKTVRGRLPLSPLGKIRRIVVNPNFRSKSFAYAWIKEIIDSTDSLLQAKKATDDQVAGTYITLDLARGYVQSFVKVAPVDRDGDPEKTKEEPPKPEEKKKKPKGQPAPPRYPELPEDYKPHTKDTDQDSEADSAVPFVVAEFNGKTAYFKQRNMNEIVRGAATPFQKGLIPLLSSKIAKAQATTHKLKLEMVGKNAVSLLIPPGFQPVASKDGSYKIVRTESGAYQVESQKERVQIPLIEEKENLTDLQKEYFARPIGFDLKEWPAQMKADVIDHVINSGPLVQAEKVENYIRTQHLYSVGKRDANDPIEALKDGAFQCDIAAYAMAGVMRDVFKVPTRVVAGYRGKSKAAGKMSYVVLPGEAHAWVEVYADGKWNTFDPTPTKKDRKDDKEKEKSDYHDNALDRHKDTPPDSPPSQGDGTSSKDQVAKVKADSDKRVKEVTGTPAGKKEDKTKENGQEGKSGAGEGKDTDDLIKKLDTGSLSLKSERTSNPLIQRALRLLLRDALDPRRMPTAMVEGLNRLSQILKMYTYPNMRTAVDRGIETALAVSRPMKDEASFLPIFMEKASLNDGFQKLLNLETWIRLFGSTLDDGAASKSFDQSAQIIEKIKDVFKSAIKVGAEEVGAVKEFYASLPSHARRVLKERFPSFESVGFNAGTKAVFKALNSGKANDLRLISALYPLTNFIMEPVPNPAYKTISTFETDSRYVRGRDVVAVDNWKNAGRALRMQPGKDIGANMREGTLFSLVRRRKINIPSPTGLTDPERISIVQYDTSGSMQGEPATFQAGLIAAFVDRALSDISPITHRHRHRAVIMGFDTSVHTIHQVADSEQALAIIRNYQESMKNTASGTDIMAALEQAFAQIADAQKRKGEPLANANIILMTDGQANVNVDQIREWRSKIDRKTDVKIMFVAINGTNPDLVALSQDIRSSGIGQSMYFEFSPERISEMLAKATQPINVDNERNYYSEKTWAAISAQATPLMRELEQSISRSVAEHSVTQTTSSLSDWDNRLQMIPPRADNGPSDMRSRIASMRTFIARTSQYLNPNLVRTFAQDIFTNFQNLLGVPMQTIDTESNESLRHLLYEMDEKNREQK